MNKIKSRHVRLDEPEDAAQQAGAMQMMSIFLAHDLKNLASGLSLAIQNMHNHADDALCRRDAMHALAECTARIHHMIRRLDKLRWRLRVQLERVDFRSWFRHAIQSCEAIHPGVIKWRDPPSRMLMMDPELLRIVLGNLIANAREASQPGRAVEVHASARNGTLTMFVRDHGAGMSRSFIDHQLFVPFQTTKPEGMGIGLYQSRVIVHAHGGRMEVESVEGEGTTFRVHLPANK